MSRRVVALVAVGVLIVMGSAGCGSDDRSSKRTSNRTQTRTTTSSPTAQPVYRVVAPPSTEPSTGLGAQPRGANAAPQAQPQTGLYLKTPDAYQAFKDWWYYEVQTPQGAGRIFSDVHEAGVAVCVARYKGASPDSAMRAAQAYYKIKDLSDSMAVTAAALRALCPWQNTGTVVNDQIGGYTTYFDKNVNSAYYAITSGTSGLTFTGGLPNRFQVGWFGKSTCNYLRDNGNGRGLVEYLYSIKDHRYGSSYMAGSDRNTVLILARLAIQGMCPGYLSAFGQS